MITPNRIQNNGIELNKSNNDLTITLTPTDGLNIDYDLLTTPKEFKLNETGVRWTNGVDTFQTSLDRLCVIQQAFSSVELPPTSNVLKINDTINLTNGTNTSSITMNANGNIVIDPSTTGTLGTNNLTIAGGRAYQELNSNANWNNVNGYLSLQKDAFASLNPASSGVKAVSVWNTRTTPGTGRSICWSPELGIFVTTTETNLGDLQKIMTSPDGINWTSRTAPTENNLISVIWVAELGLFVAVGDSGTLNRVTTSPDGITWTARTTPNNNNWFNVCWSRELRLLVAVAYSGGTDRVMTSPDGFTWTARTTPNANNYAGLAWSGELGLFVATAYSGTLNRAMTSPDGINWTARTTPTNNNYQSCCWSPEVGLFVATSVTGTLDRVMTSPDGINWTARTTPNDNVWRKVIWSKELRLFVTIASSGTGNRIMSSPNGINWTARTTPIAGDSISYRSIAWSPELGMFCGIGFTNAAPCALTSNLAGRVSTGYNTFDNPFNNIDSNGNWSFKAKSITSSDGNIIIDPTNNLNVIGRTYQELNASSNWVDVNGFLSLQKDAFASLNPYSTGVKAVSSWTIRNTPFGLIRGIVWAAELGLFVGASAIGSLTSILTSPDGINWTARTTPNTNTLQAVCWAPEISLLVAVSSTGGSNRVTTSPDGITWTARTTPNTNEYNGVCWSPELRLFVAVSVTGTLNRAMTSPDGITWTARTTPTSNNYQSVCWAAELGLFVSVASSGANDRVMTSPDGITWTTRIPSNNNSWNSVCWSPELGLFAAVATSGGANDRVMTSPDGITWLSRVTIDNTWRSVIWCPELRLFVSCASSGTGNRIMYSPNGITWTTRTAPDANNRGIAWAPELGIFCCISTDAATNCAMTSSLVGRIPTSYNVFDSSFNNIDSSGNWTFKAKEVSSNDSNVSMGSTSGNTEIKCNAVGAGGTITLTGGTNLVTATAGGNAGQHLALTINGVAYKIALLNP